ncbi:hypothetical protein AVEN_265031-1 [Araneus ventricosus]|uniref:Uncharacterized protein n=1 Tax=Araneus ventricosus TaxID=182803 RepID=A0A4Y2EL68_ARAVE|nr:hypothetical protein AVEN_265031-1 [Araneus ventricosus]
MDFFSLSSKCRSQHSNCGWTWNFHVTEGVHCVTPVQLFQTCSCIPPWIGVDFARQGARSARQGHDLLSGATSVMWSQIIARLLFINWLNTRTKYPTWGPSVPHSGSP